MNNHSGKSQIAKKPVLRYLAVSIFALSALTGAAYAQAGDDAMLKAKDAADAKAIDNYINRAETDEKYQKTIRDQPSAATSNDPWGNVRTTTTPANSAARPAAKPATKTASGSGKLTAIKPTAIKPTPATNGTAQKSQ
jgi:hypothetical protein